MEKKSSTSPGPQRAKKTNSVNNNNIRRSSSKSPVRPKTPTRNISQDSGAAAPVNSATKSSSSAARAKSNGNISGNPTASANTQVRKSLANVAGTPGTSSDKNVNDNSIATSAKNNTAIEIPEASDPASTTTATANAQIPENNNVNNNTEADASSTTAATPAAPPAVTSSKMSNSSKTGNAGGSASIYRNTSMNMSRTFPAVPRLMTNTLNNRNAFAKSGINILKNHTSNVFRAAVEKAVREHKVYTIVGMYPAVRNALKKRGWIEKSFSTHLAMKNIHSQSQNKETDFSRGSEEESDQAWLVRVLKDYPPDFIWVIRRDNIEWRLLHKDQIINRYPKAFFTTKVGITACLQNIHWYSEPGVAEILFPRCYRLCFDEEKTAFVDDFRLTACFSLLKTFVITYDREGESGFHDGNSRMTLLNIEFAMRQVNNYIRMRRHEDIDWLMPPPLTNHLWDAFLTSYYEICQGRMKFNWKDSQESIKGKVDQIRRLNQRAALFWPQYQIDGTGSLWICKPGARSRGKGIIILSQLDKVLDLLSSTNFREANWVVQKYIERPLLVYKTKFDIRQWFIITDWTPLTIWFYKESYIRFCTKPFTLVDFHESVHLCNNAVQCRYTNSEFRDTALPEENMWDCYTFQAYLNTVGKMEAWEKTIYPGMKQAIVGVLLASQETVENRKNCFELYGADFMLSEDLKPWLIEINSCPCMASSTSVTARLCGACLEDTLKVVLDRRLDRNCDTGCFEMIYKQSDTGFHTSLYGGSDLILTGKKMSRDIDWPGIMTKYNAKRGSGGTPVPLGVLTPRNETTDLQYAGITFTDLVDRLRTADDDDSRTTPHSQSTVDATPESSFQNALRKYRRAQQYATPPEVSNTNNNLPDNSVDNSHLQTSPSQALDKAGILKVKKLQTGPPDPVILYNGIPSTNYNGNSKPVSYNEMYPLFNHLSNKPQNFATFGNRASQNRSMYANGVNYNSAVVTPGPAMQSAPPGFSGGSKSLTQAYPSAPLSLLAGYTTPVAPTMADLFRISRDSSVGLNRIQQEPIYRSLNGQSSRPIPAVLINPMKTKSLKIRSGQSTRSTNLSPMRVPNPPVPTTSGPNRTTIVNSQKYGKMWTHYKIKCTTSSSLSRNNRSCKPRKSNQSSLTFKKTSSIDKSLIKSSDSSSSNVSNGETRTCNAEGNNFLILTNCSPTSGRTTTKSKSKPGREGKRPSTQPILRKPSQTNPNKPPDSQHHSSGATSNNAQLPLPDYAPPPSLDLQQFNSSTKTEPKVSSSNVTQNQKSSKSETNVEFAKVTGKDSVNFIFSKYSSAFMIYPVAPIPSQAYLDTIDTENDSEDSQNRETEKNFENKIQDTDSTKNENLEGESSAGSSESNNPKMEEVTAERTSS